MYEYSDKERAEVQSRIEDERYKNKSCDLSMAYQLYDLLRVNLECVADIDKRLSAIEENLKS